MVDIQKDKKENLYEYKEYDLYKSIIDNKKYKIKIGKGKNYIYINYENYEIYFNNIYLSNLSFDYKFDSIDDAYKFIIYRFEREKVYFKELIINIKLSLLIEINKEKDIQIDLVTDNENKYNIIVDPNEDKQNIIYNKEKNTYSYIKNIDFITNLAEDAYHDINCLIDNMFIIFNSVFNIYYLFILIFQNQ